MRVLAERSDVRVRWVCDLDPGRLGVMARRYPGVGVTRELDVVLGDPAVEAVLLATPVFSHHALARRCLEADNNAFVEKPWRPRASLRGI